MRVVFLSVRFGVESIPHASTISLLLRVCIHTHTHTHSHTRNHGGAILATVIKVSPCIISYTLYTALYTKLGNNYLRTWYRCTYSVIAYLCRLALWCYDCYIFIMRLWYGDQPQWLVSTIYRIVIVHKIHVNIL
jgi:hypothetical protein